MELRYRAIGRPLAAALASILAAPLPAQAQSAIAISGIFKVSVETLRIGQGAAARVGRNNSETRVADDSSRIAFNVTEDLGGGLQAIGQVTLQLPMSSGNVLQASGNTHLGMRSASMGRLFIGRQDVHYYNNESFLTYLAGDLRADSISVVSFMRDGVTAIAGATRTPNIIHYLTPNWGGFTAILAYSTGPSPGPATGQPNGSNVGAAFNPALIAQPQQGDLQSGIRKGYAIHVNPNFAGPNYRVGWSYWKSRPDVVAGATQPGNTLSSGDQLGNKLYGSFDVSGLRIGVVVDKSRIKASTPGAGLAGVSGIGGIAGGAFSAGTELGNRTAWSIPMTYATGNNRFHFHYTRARDDRATQGIRDGARMIALSYQYLLSKRTAVGLTYAKITNDTGAAYNFFTSTSLGNSAGSAVTAGEDPRIFSGTIRHAF